MVTNSNAFRSNSSGFCSSHGHTHFPFHNCNSSTNGLRYTSMSLPGCLGPWMTRSFTTMLDQQFLLATSKNNSHPHMKIHEQKIMIPSDQHVGVDVMINPPSLVISTMEKSQMIHKIWSPETRTFYCVVHNSRINSKLISITWTQDIYLAWCTHMA